MPHPDQENAELILEAVVMPQDVLGAELSEGAGANYLQFSVPVLILPLPKRLSAISWLEQVVMHENVDQAPKLGPSTNNPDSPTHVYGVGCNVAAAVTITVTIGVALALS